MRNFPELVATIQHNCDISDARHAGDYGLCTYLLKMREYYRWENEIPYFSEIPKDDISAWLTAREQRWQQVESSVLLSVPLESGRVDPFDSDSINRELVPQGYVYSGGYGRFHKPIFFLGRLLKQEERDGFRVFTSSCEYARELAAPPAMAQGQTIFVRQESARRFAWEKLDEWQWTKRDNALGRAIACYASGDNEALLDHMTDDAMKIMVLHELGEGLIGELLGDQWAPLLADLSHSKAEIVARAVRDHIADCRSTLPALLEGNQPASLHFYFANLDGMRRQLFTDLRGAYRKWVEAGDLQPLRQTVQQDADKWLDIAQSFLDTYKADHRQARVSIERLVNPRPH